MPMRRFLLSAVALVVWVSALPAAQIRTQNFLVTAPDEQIARQFGQMAEVYRKQKAIEWLGAEIPPWTAPCPLTVKPSLGGSGGGATSFNYDRGSYTIISMDISGPLERMLNSVLPHEVTHTIFAHHFRAPVPRWADEGGAVLSEDDIERGRHDQLCRTFLNSQQKVSMRRLFTLREYHEVDNVMKIYAQGYSVTDYLVGLSERQTFLNFVATGMRNGWDRAVQTYYQLNSVEELEEAWLQHLRTTRDTVRNHTGSNGTMLAANTGASGNTSLTGREIVRLTAPPAQPQLEPVSPVFRGQIGDDHRSGRAYDATRPSAPGVVPLGSNPGAARTNPNAKPPVTLGMPEFAPAPQSQPISPAGPSPVGHQN
ncbi:MAG: hypothetical protein ACJ8C4_14805 [Gemmataceae bacterium]